MSRTVEVTVTAEDIAQGCPGNGHDCPIARAVHRLGYPTATAGHTGLWLQSFCSEFIVLPAEAREFARRFDDGYPVKPFSFVVDLDKQVIP